MSTIQNEEEVSNKGIKKRDKTFKTNKFISQSCETLGSQNLEGKANNYNFIGGKIPTLLQKTEDR